VKTKILLRGCMFVFLGVVVLINLYPLLWMIMSSFKTTPEIFSSPWGLPKGYSFSNFTMAWKTGKIGQYVLNSVKVTGLSVSVMVFFAAMAAYGIVRQRRTWAKPMLFFFLAGQMIPAQVVIIPLFLEIDMLGLVNSHFALILIYVAAGLPFTVFLLQGFVQGVPQDLYDAAVIDGLGEFGIFSKVTLPLIKPGIAAAVIFQSLWVWNEFLLALIILRKPQSKTIPIGLWQAVVGWVPRYDLALAALTMVSLPIIVVFAINQRHFIRGLTEGAVKG